MAPEYGATCGIFPVDQRDARLPALHRPGRRAGGDLVEAYCKEQGLFRTAETPEAEYTDALELDLGDRRAEPRRPRAAAGPGRA